MPMILTYEVCLSHCPHNERLVTGFAFAINHTWIAHILVIVCH